MEMVATEILLASLAPGLRDCLKTREDGTILDGHHRLYVLRRRGVDIESLARDIIERDEE